VGTNTFYIIVFSGVFVLALISVLVWALVRIKKQNDLIVAKVEKFKEEEMPQ
jgi:type IV secretory pathway VirB3-like protein